MKNMLFKRKTEKETSPKTEGKVIKVKEKPMNEIIEEIHETFYTEVDRLLEYANIKREVSVDKEAIEKSKKLKALGFGASKPVKNAANDEFLLRKLEREELEKSDLKEAIQYFSFKYPNYKFITEESVKKICKKYNLVYSSVENYIGDVPDKNLKEIENFKIKDEDILYSEHFGPLLGKNSFRGFVNHEYFQNKRNHYPHDFYVEKNPLEIAAPLKDFNAKNLELNDFELTEKVILDPVVLHPVFFKSQKHYLIVTAWGEEASDELVVNQKMN